MSKNRNTTLSFFKTIGLSLFGASLLIYLVTATILSLFGHSLWSWMNVLRFVLGGFILVILVAYFFIIKMLVQASIKDK